MYKLRLILAMLFFSFVAQQGSASSLNVDLLSEDDCYDNSIEDVFIPENQRYWYKRNAPYLGYKHGEELLAGGDGTCIIGFPKISEETALISINGKKIKLFPEPSNNISSQKLSSKNGALQIEVVETGGDTTCEPQGEKCCGDYTYATIIVSTQKKTIKIKAVNYSGS